MTTGWNTPKYLALFVTEATEHLEALAAQVVKLEQGATPTLIDALFRHAHSIKGMSASMGFGSTAQLGHRLEDVLSTLREQPTKADRSVVDAILASVDVLTSHVRAAEAQQPMPDVAAHVAKLEALLVTLKSAPGDTVPVVAPTNAEPLALGPPRFTVTVRISPTSTQPGVRGFLAYKRLSLLGNVFDPKPALDDIKAGRIPENLVRFTLETEVPEAEITKTLSAIADVSLDSMQVVSSVPAAPTAPSATPEPEAPRIIGQEPARTVRVRTELLDQFLDAAGELLLATARVRESGKAMPEAARPVFDESVDRLHALVRELHEKVMTARMTPIAVVTDRLPRAARDIARRRGRDVELIVTGADIELDRAIVDELGDPVLHLLRNAIDHGIEPPEERRMKGKDARGKVSVNVRRLRDTVIFDLEDDGRGIDVERLKRLAVDRGLLTADDAAALDEKAALMLSCLPGLSTASTVTDISGRGVGMDVVKRAVEAFGGTLELQSTRNKGTRCRLVLPLTVAMVRLLLVGVGREVFGLPIARISGVVELPRAQLSATQNAPVLHFGASVLPVYELSTLLGVEVEAINLAAPTPFVVVERDDGRIALAVGRLLGQEEVVLKALTPPLDLVRGLAGVTILGNGQPVFILDPSELVGP